MYDVKEDSFPGVSKELDDRAGIAANRTWDSIGYDCLVNDMGEPDESAVMSREDVLEIVRDANHMETFGGDEEAARYFIWVSRFHPEHYKKVVKRFFPFERYGH
jgi:hypothetical protein